MAMIRDVPTEEELTVAREVVAWLIDDVGEHVPQSGQWIDGLRVAHAQIELTIADRKGGD